MRVYITMECSNCDTTIKQPLDVFNEGVPEISYDIAAQETFTCPECDTSHHLGDFEWMTDDEI